jgi:hypothetical protein
LQTRLAVSYGFVAVDASGLRRTRSREFFFGIT